VDYNKIVRTNRILEHLCININYRRLRTSSQVRTANAFGTVIIAARFVDVRARVTGIDSGEKNGVKPSAVGTSSGSTDVFFDGLTGNGKKTTRVDVHASVLANRGYCARRQNDRNPRAYRNNTRGPSRSSTEPYRSWRPLGADFADRIKTEFSFYRLRAHANDIAARHRRRGCGPERPYRLYTRERN